MSNTVKFGIIAEHRCACKHAEEMGRKTNKKKRTLVKEGAMSHFYKEDWSTHFSLKNIYQKNQFFEVFCVCARV